jgi:hypothetical protein
MKKTPHPAYQEPKYLHTPLNTDFAPYSDEQLEKLSKYATNPVVLPSKPVSTKTSSKKSLSALPKLVPPTTNPVDAVIDLTHDPVLPVPPVLPVIPPLQLKQDKFKRPKPRPPLSPNHRIRINEAKKTVLNWKLLLPQVLLLMFILLASYLLPLNMCVLSLFKLVLLLLLV